MEKKDLLELQGKEEDQLHRGTNAALHILTRTGRSYRTLKLALVELNREKLRKLRSQLEGEPHGYRPTERNGFPLALSAALHPVTMFEVFPLPEAALVRLLGMPLEDVEALVNRRVLLPVIHSYRDFEGLHHLDSILKTQPICYETGGRVLLNLISGRRFETWLDDNMRVFGRHDLRKHHETIREDYEWDVDVTYPHFLHKMAWRAAALSSLDAYFRRPTPMLLDMSKPAQSLTEIAARQMRELHPVTHGLCGNEHAAGPLVRDLGRARSLVSDEVEASLPPRLLRLHFPSAVGCDDVLEWHARKVPAFFAEFSRAVSERTSEGSSREEIHRAVKEEWGNLSSAVERKHAQLNKTLEIAQIGLLSGIPVSTLTGSATAPALVGSALGVMTAGKRTLEEVAWRTQPKLQRYYWRMTRSKKRD